MKRLTLLIRPNPDDSWIGGAIYFRNLINSIRLAADVERWQVELVIVYEDRNHLPSVDRLLPADLKRIFVSDFEDIELNRNERSALNDVPPGPERRNLRRTFIYGRIIESVNGDLIFPYFPAGNHRLPCAVVSWVPDLQHVRLPEFFDQQEIDIRDRKYSAAAHLSDAIVLSSESARRDFHEKYSDYKTRLSILRFYTLPEVRWYEIDHRDVIRRFGLPDTYFVVSNQFWAHKNHKVVVEALKILDSRGIKPFVVCTGGVSDNRRTGVIDGFLQQICESGLWDRFRILGQLPRIEQIQVLRGARAIIQPSLFEGWSTVLEDCRTLGQEVVASRLDVHVEQGVPGTRFFDPMNPGELAEQIEDCMNTPRPFSVEREAEARAMAEKRAIECGKNFLALAAELDARKMK
ncbi:MAG: glycosyltransferase [Verrucomicrobiae bacterium]|nr:glycosyltransferase [Verrucomicrobiae bacterium]